MLSQVVILSVALAIATADVSSFYPHASPQANSVDFDPNPQYSYSYSVNDAHTGDNHAQEETRNGDSVHGSYSLIEADGTLRTVKYTADAVNGFNAVVEHSGGASRSVSTPVVRIASPAPLPIARASSVVPVAPRSYSTGGAAVHTSFSGPHASYQY